MQSVLTVLMSFLEECLEFPKPPQLGQDCSWSLELSGHTGVAQVATAVQTRLGVGTEQQGRVPWKDRGGGGNKAPGGTANF